MTTSTKSTDPGETGGEPERIQKFLSRAGVASRRGAEDLILAGRISVNGVVVTELGTKIVAGVDVVALDGKAVAQPDRMWYFMLNKPAGVVTTMDDPQGRATVTGYVPAGTGKLFPVGRLDYETTGLLLLTNDGDFAHMLMHPRFHVPKTYIAEVDGVPDESDLRRLREGVELDDGMTAPAEARVLKVSRTGSTVEIVLREGRKRQVRRMLSWVGHPVRALARVAYGALGLGDLPQGEVRPLDASEVDSLRSMATGAGEC